MKPVDALTVSINELRVGQYIHLDLKWFEHPFSFNHFKIRSESQIEEIKALGLKSIRITPELSDPVETQAPAVVTAKDTPHPSTDGKTASAVQGDAVTGAAELPAQSTATPELLPESAPSKIMQAKRAMVARMREQRDKAERIECAFADTVSVIHNIEKNLYSRPKETMEQATQLIKKIADSILSAPELAIQVMGDKLGGEDLYFHSLNVTMLALMMARDLNMMPEVAGMLGVGALMHDIGHQEVPAKILLKTEPLTQAERNLFEMHFQFGVDIAQRMQLAAPVIAIIREHHELDDGSGYPLKLKGQAINPLARMVVITNFYDELCNPANLADALTPHEALSLMFAKLRTKFDAKFLQVLIRCLGVYPPGTIVQLSNGSIGMVATVNTAKPMKPVVMVYDAEVPKEEAILLDMETELDVNIAKAIRPIQIPREVYNYLSPRKRVSYYFDASSKKPQGNKS
jgi:putative nucleotidyltransferase with HDIG domain